VRRGSKQRKEVEMGDESDANTVTLRVRDQGGDEMFFKVKKETKMSKIMEAYATRKGVNATALRFTVDGERIEKEDTPKMLELENDDQIDVLLEATGGGKVRGGN
jgi:small ubiquitin-related modifier